MRAQKIMNVPITSSLAIMKCNKGLAIVLTHTTGLCTILKSRHKVLFRPNLEANKKNIKK